MKKLTFRVISQFFFRAIRLMFFYISINNCFADWAFLLYYITAHIKTIFYTIIREEVRMFKKLMIVVVLILAGAIVVYANNYNVSGLSYNGYMTGPGDTDYLILAGQEGANPTVCLSHGPGVDFDFQVINDGNVACQNDSVDASTCCRANTPGQVRIKVWSVTGSGNYSVTIRP